MLALIAPVVMGIVAIGSLVASDGAVSGLTGLLLGVMAAPGLLVVGVPFSDRSLYPVGIGLSIVLWLAVGVIAARRATRNPMATSADFWRAYWWLAAGTWAGVIAALLVARIQVGRALI